MNKVFLIFTFVYANLLFAGLFDDRYPSARATAMSDAFVAVSNDVWAAYYNPAGLATVENYNFGLSYQAPYNLPFFKNYFLSGTAPLPSDFGTVGISVQNFGVSYLGNNLSGEYTFALSHGFYLMNDIHSSLSAGYNLKYYYWELGESVGGLDLGSGGTVGVDLAFQASLYGRTYVGIYFLNINAPNIGEITKHDLPQRIVIGAAYRPQNEITTSLAMNKTIGLDTQIEGGFEFQIIEMLALRLGVSTDPNRFSGGFGLNYQNIYFDYAIRTHPVLSETHQFGLSYILGK